MVDFDADGLTQVTSKAALGTTGLTIAAINTERTAVQMGTTGGAWVAFLL